MENCTVGLKNHDPCFHKKCKEAGVMKFEAHCATLAKVLIKLPRGMIEIYDELDQLSWMTCYNEPS